MYIQRGVCGVTLRLQCLTIGITHIAVSLISIILASLMLRHPLYYLDLNAMGEDASEFANISANSTELEDLEDKTAMDEEERLTRGAIHDVEEEGIELLVGGIASMVTSVLLVQGIRQEKIGLIFPWVIVTILEMVAAFISFAMRMSSPHPLPFLKIFAAMIYFSISSYFTLSVYSYYQIIKIKKRKVITFLDHEFQGGEGSWYHALQEEPVPPYTEKAVPMTDEDDRGRENVLFAK